MQVVIDTSALIAVVANEPEKLTLVAATTGAELVAPASLHWEVGNAFSAMLKRERITFEQADAALKEYARIPIRLIDLPLRDTLELAHELGIYAYDAYFLVAARTLRCELLTLDRGLMRAARQSEVPLLETTP
jgi:predicted nucleic acid-binding protein